MLSKAWSRTRTRRVFGHVGPAQVILKEVFAVLLWLMTAFLAMSGEGFEKRQCVAAARSKRTDRKYAVLAAAEGKEVARCMQFLLQLFWVEPLAMLGRRLSMALRIIRFTMLSASVCTLHVLLRIPRQGCPYKVFTALGGNAEELLAMPACMRDSLAHVILERYATGLCALTGV